MANFKKIYNYLRLSSRIDTAGQPLEDEIPMIIENGTEVVISLVPEGVSDEVPSEQTLFEQNSIVFKRIPVQWESPEKENFQTFLSIMDRYKDKQMFIHCQANMRVSVFMALYHIIVKGWQVQDAMVEVRKIWNPDDIWQAFFEQILSDHQVNAL